MTVIEMILTGMRRRKKELTLTFIVTLIAAFFMSGVLMAGSILKFYLLEKNRDSYGDWIIASDSENLAHPYLIGKGSLKCSGVRLTDENGKMLGRKIGSADEEILSFSRISLYEGHFPEKNDEIAADLSTLSKLGYSYETGQQIRFYYKTEGEEEELIEKSYTLVGILKPFSGQWIAIAPFYYPDFLVTEEELGSYGEEIDSRTFYRMDPSLRKVDAGEFYDAFSKTVSDQEIALSFNSYTYDTGIFGDASFWQVRVMLIVLAAFAISFVLSSYADRRREALYRLRMLGCTRWKLSGILALECGISAAVPAALGIGLSYLAAFIICRISAGALGLQGFFAFEGKVFLVQLGAVFGSVLLAVLLIVLRSGSREPGKEAKALRPSQLRTIRRRLPRLKAPGEDFFLRRRILKRRAGLAAAVFTVVAVSFMLFCGKAVYDALRYYSDENKRPDFELTVFAPEQLEYEYRMISEDGEEIIDGGTTGGLVIDPGYGPDPGEIAQLSSGPGIDSVEGMVWDTTHFITFEGISERPDLQTGYYFDGETKYHTLPEKTLCAINTVSEPGKFRKMLKDFGASLSEEQIEQVLRGERIFMTVPEELFTVSGQEPLPEGLPPQDGDLIRIFTVDEKHSLEVPASVLQRGILPYSYMNYVMNTMFTVFMADGLKEELRLLENPVPEYVDNHFLFHFNSFSSYEATDKILSAYAAGFRNKEFYNWAESKRSSILLYAVRPLLIYGMLGLMTVIVYLIIMKNFAEIRASENAAESRRLRAIGLNAHKYRLMLLRAESREALPVFLGFLAGVVWFFVSAYKSFSSSPGLTESVFLKKWTDKHLLLSLESVLFRSGIQYLLLFVILLFLGLVLFGYHTGKRAMEKEGIL